MKFSIIVPCYNLAPWIRACLNSIAVAIKQCKRSCVKWIESRLSLMMNQPTARIVAFTRPGTRIVIA